MATPRPDFIRPSASRRRGHLRGTHLPCLLALCTVAAAVAPAAAAVAQASPERVKSPRPAAIARAPAVIADATIATPSLRRLVGPGSYWGGRFEAADGETVTVYFSNTYPQDPTAGTRWANFLAGLVHGAELGALTVYLAPLTEVEDACGSGALACYAPGPSLLVAPGTDPSASISAEAVVTHEYGHHVAAHRSNAPWAAVDYGTKRWASYEQVCARARSGDLAPGAEQAPAYERNPGEAFAETYRVLNERREGVPETPWNIVSQTLYPDARALAAVQQDVLRPWRQPAASSRAGSLATRARTYTLATPLDGTLKVTLRPPARALVVLDVFSPAGTRVAHAVASKAVSLTRTICGERSLRIRVTRLSGAGTFRLAIAAP